MGTSDRTRNWRGSRRGQPATPQACCLLGAALLVLLLQSCGGGSATLNPGPGNDGAAGGTTDGSGQPEPTPGGSGGTGSHAADMLAAIPQSVPGFPAATAGSLPAGEFSDGIETLGGAACRYWLDTENGQLFLSFVFDMGSAGAAAGLLAELRPSSAEDSDLGAGSFSAADPGRDGDTGFSLLGLSRGQYVGLVGAARTAADAAMPAPGLLHSQAELLASALSALPAHAASQLSTASAAPAALETPGGPRESSLVYHKLVTVPLKRGSQSNGAVTFALDITPTDSACGHWDTPPPGQPGATADSCDPAGPPSYCHIVQVFIAGISLGDYDGDGPGRGSGDLMAGGELTISFKRGTKVTRKTLSFATGELGDCDTNSSLDEGSSPEILPKFLKTIEGCGIPSSFDCDVLVRDNDEGADVADLIEVLVVGAAEGGVGKSTGEVVESAIKNMREQTPDKTGTPGMQELRSRAGDDVGEAHDTQIGLLAE